MAESQTVANPAFQVQALQDDGRGTRRAGEAKDDTRTREANGAARDQTML